MPEAGGRARMEYRVTGGEYLGFLLGRLLLVGITFGLYGFWLGGDLRRWKAERTYVNGQPLRYQASVADFALSWLVKSALLLLSFGLYLPWARVKSERWTWRHTTVADGRTCRFDGEGGAYLAVFAVSALMRLFTLGLASPWALAYRTRWQRQHLTIGGERVEFRGTGGDFFLRSLGGKILTVMTCGLYLPWHLVNLDRWLIESSWVAQGTDTSPVPADPAEATIARLAADRRTWIGVGALAAAALLAVGVTTGASALLGLLRDEPEPVAAAALAGLSPAGVAEAQAAGEEEEEVGCDGEGDLSDGFEMWSFAAKHRIIVRPAVAGERVVVGSMDGAVYAIDAATGEVAWRTSGIAVKGSPLVVRDRVILGGTAVVSAFRLSDGERLWSASAQGNASAPVLAGDLVLVQTERDGLVALDPASGETRWSFKTGYFTDRSGLYDPMPGPIAASGWAFVGSSNGNVYALDAATGEERWASDLGSRITSTPAVAGGLVYVGTADGRLVALDGGSGAPRWTAALGEGPVADPVVRGGAVYAGTRDGALHALGAADGQKRWKFRAGGGIRAAAAVGGGAVYVPSWDGTLYALDAATGAERWRFDPGPRAAHGLVAKGHFIAPPLLVDQRLYVGSEDYHLYALFVTGGPDPEPDPGLPEAPLPDLLGGVASITATSELREPDGRIHRAAHLLDGSQAHAWCEGVAGEGVGERLRLRLEPGRRIAGIEVVNGFTKSAGLLKSNGQVARFEVRIDGKAAEPFSLPRDARATSHAWRMPAGRSASEIELEIAAAHSGTRYQDTCISELRVLDERDVRLDVLREKAREHVLGPADLAGLPPEDLALLRSAILADGGQRFEDPALNDYFTGRLWYAPVADPPQPPVSARASIEVIRAVEAGGMPPEAPAAEAAEPDAVEASAAPEEAPAPEAPAEIAEDAEQAAPGQ